ncbi:MAG TPA: RidA family protein [Gemmatimonadaceae bacterium]|nr:RidA family protein [Gemmatimonadaceae bacterium]
MTRLLVLVLVALLALPPAAAAQQRGQMAAPEYISGGPNAPYSRAVRVGRMIYLAGMIGADAGGKLATGGIQAETRQALENIKATLEPLGATMDDVIKCTVFLADIAEWGAMTEAYVAFFPNNKPARTAVAVAGLPLNARVEIECMAVRRS